MLSKLRIDSSLILLTNSFFSFGLQREEFVLEFTFTNLHSQVYKLSLSMVLDNILSQVSQETHTAECTSDKDASKSFT